MARNRLLLIVAVVVVIALGAWWYFRAGRENVAVDLLQQFPSAKQQPAAPGTFTVTDVTINGEKKKAIAMPPTAGTRITWHITVPDNGWVKVAMALKEDGWKTAGDGVDFAVGVSDQKTYDELLRLNINPFGNAGDRRWNEVSLDLSQYAGETVDLIFNTRSGAKNDTNGDFAVWGNPRVIIR